VVKDDFADNIHLFVSANRREQYPGFACAGLMVRFFTFTNVVKKSTRVQDVPIDGVFNFVSQPQGDLRSAMTVVI
jgi:hypothetical protein